MEYNIVSLLKRQMCFRFLKLLVYYSYLVVQSREVFDLKVMAIVLAAGQGKRMKSKLYKVLHPVCGKPMVGHVLDVVKQANAERSVVIVGHGADLVKSYLGDGAEYVLQEQQLGTGHAVRQAEALLGDEEGTTIVICGDTPLVQASTISAMLELHASSGLLRLY
jgi:bifunctional UDP-N-acetylglucosamine pyrophosphorylase/glucosamine-1-phosphate N-acetyltransferase